MATATETNILEAQTREPGSKNEAKRVRREERFRPWSMARAKTRSRSRSIRAGDRAF